MPERPSKPLYPNPFYVLLLVASVAFVVTTFGYLVGPKVMEQAAKPQPGGGGGPNPGSIAAARWFDQRGPIALAVEFGVMLVAALLAMLTDRWFPAKTAPSRKV